MSAQDQIQAVVRRCRRGERAAFEELFRHFQPRLRYYVRRLDTGHDHTDDVLQDIWVKVVRQIGSLKDCRAFPAWLYTIARHEVYTRTRVRDPFLESTDEGLEQVEDDHEPVFDGEDTDRLHAALARLRPHHREILTLCFLEEFSHEQIAGILGLRAGTVKSRIYYAKRSLRQELETNHGPS
jgi:RNA polymerase sigma-70 factor (ECF subfamily)